MKNISFGKGIVTYDEFNIDINKPLESQIWELNEDLLQIDYSDKEGNCYVLDVGWYPEFNENGMFRIVLVRNFDWVNPVLVRTSNIKDINDVLADCVERANSL